MEKFTRAAELAGGKSGQRSSNGWVRFPHPCNPSKDDALSFAVTEKPDGTVIIKSQKPNYSNDDCLSALGLTRSDFFPQDDLRGPRVTSKGTCTRTYEYTDTNGKPVGAVNRIHNGEKKSFQQLRYEGAKCLMGLGGVKLPLFEADKVADAVKIGETIYITEGEKDALALWGVGMVATTKAGGSGSAWEPHLVDALRGANIVLVMDRDDAGFKAAIAGFVALSEVAKSFKIVEAAEGKDAYDHLAAGFTVQDFVDRSDVIPQKERFVTEKLNGTFKPVELDYLWEPYLPLRKAILLDADSGTGKTTLCLAIAAGLSNGVLPNGDGRCEPVRTLYFKRDKDTAEEMETVYRANGGREGWIEYVTADFLFNDKTFELMENTIAESGAKLVIIDPFFYYLPVKSVNDAVEVLPYCARVGDIAEKLGVTVIAIRHVSKGAMMAGGNFGGMGSVQFRASFRGNLLMRKHPEEKGVIVLLDDKGSLLNPTGDTLAFRRRDRYAVEWIQNFDDPFNKSDKRPAHRPEGVGVEVRDEIEKLVNAGSTLASDLKQAVIKATGCNPATYHRVLSSMGLTKSGKYYSLPASYDPFSDFEDDPVYRGGD